MFFFNCKFYLEVSLLWGLPLISFNLWRINGGQGYMLVGNLVLCFCEHILKKISIFSRVKGTFSFCVQGCKGGRFWSCAFPEPRRSNDSRNWNIQVDGAWGDKSISIIYSFNKSFISQNCAINWKYSLVIELIRGFENFPQTDFCWRNAM